MWELDTCASATGTSRTETLHTRSLRRLPKGSYFENLTGRSQRLEGTAALYLPPRHWMGQHDLKAGLDLDHISDDQEQSRTPVSYLREDGTLTAPERLCAGAGLHDAQRRDRRVLRGSLAAGEGMGQGLLWSRGCDSTGTKLCGGRSLSPRLAAVYSPPGDKNQTKISAGIGLYYEHTQLEYLAQTFAGVRFDTYYATDGVTPTGPAQETEFTVNDGCAARAARC